MKLKFTYIRFELGGDAYDGHPYYKCLNVKSKDVLGNVFWDKAWKQYIFQAQEGAVWSLGCLRDVIVFMEQLK